MLLSKYSPEKVLIGTCVHLEEEYRRIETGKGGGAWKEPKEDYLSSSVAGEWPQTAVPSKKAQQLFR